MDNKVELKDEELQKVAGGEVDGERLNLLVNKVQKEIDYISTYPICLQLDCCQEAKLLLEEARDNLLNHRLQNAFYKNNEARAKILAGINSLPEYADLLSNIDKKLISIMNDIVDLTEY